MGTRLKLNQLVQAVNSKLIGNPTGITGDLVEIGLGSSLTFTSNNLGVNFTTLDGIYYKQGGNSFGSNGNIGTNDPYSFWLRTNGTIRGGFTSTGNFHIGSQGSGTSPYIGPISGASTAYNDAGKGLMFYNYYNSDGGTAYDFAFLGSTLSHTSGGNYNVISARAFSPTSGSGSYADFFAGATINQTGGANGSTYGFLATPNLIAAADYRAFQSSNNTGLAFYAGGVARSRFNGSVGINTTPSTNVTFHNLGLVTGGSAAYQNLFGGVIQSDVTASAFYNRTQARTQAASFTLTNLYHYSASRGTIGAGSAITNEFGFAAESSLTGATNSYGFYGAIAAGTGRYNLYMAGTAQNYLGGNLAINGDKLQVSPYELHKTYSVSFANSVSNQKVDILLGNISMDVAVDIIVSSSYSSANAAGYLHKRTYFGANPSNAIWGNNVGVRYVEASGTIVNEFAIGNIVWDATLSQYKLTVAHLTSFANQIAIYLVFRSKNTTAINNISSNISIGSVYTTDATVFPTAYVTFAAKTGFQSLANAAGDFATFDASGYIQKRTAAQVLGDISAQAQLNGTGFVKASGTTISYDNSTYINKLSTLATDASKTFGSTAGLDFLGNTTGSTNYPTSTGFAVEFSTGFSTSPSAYNRDFTLYHTYGQDDWYLRRYDNSGLSSGFKRLWHSGDFTSTDVSHWNTAYGWGDFRTYGLASGVAINAAITGDVLSFTSTEFVRVSSSATNLPVAHNGYVLRIVRSSTGGSEYRKIVYYDDNGDTWENIQTAGVWVGWKKNGVANSIYGTTNYIPKFTASDTIGNSQLYESSGKIGIGTTAPGATLSIEDGDIFVRNGGDGVILSDNYGGTAESGIIYGDYATSSFTRIGTYTPGADKFRFGGEVASAGAITIDNAHNKVGIFKDSPAYTFDVTGDIALSNKLYMYDSPNSGYSSLQYNDEALRITDVGGIRSDFEFTATSDRAYQFPDTSGTVALQSWVTSQGFIIGNQTITLSGDVTGTGTTGITTTIANNSVTTAKIANSNVTLSKLENIPTNSILGQNTGVSDHPYAISLDSSFEMTNALKGCWEYGSSPSGGTEIHTKTGTLASYVPSYFNHSGMGHAHSVVAPDPGAGIYTVQETDERIVNYTLSETLQIVLPDPVDYPGRVLKLNCKADWNEIEFVSAIGTPQQDLVIYIDNTNHPVTTSGIGTVGGNTYDNYPNITIQSIDLGSGTYWVIVDGAKVGDY